MKNQNQFKIVDEEIVNDVEILIQSILKTTKGGYAIHQTKDYQNWRIYHNPYYQKVFTYGFYDKKNHLKALILLNSNDQGISYICQSTFHTDLTESEIIEIIKHVTYDSFNKGTSIIRNWHFSTNQQNSKEITLFRRSNYIHLQRGIGMVWKELTPIGIKAQDFFLSRMSTQGIV